MYRPYIIPVREGWLGHFYGYNEDGLLNLQQTDYMICSGSHGWSVAEIKLDLGHPCQLGLSTMPAGFLQDGCSHKCLGDVLPYFS